MKAKEIIPSLRASWRLKKIPAKTLKAKTSNCLPLTVTLTSIPSRLNKIDLTIRSILNQSQKPEKIILWLNNDLEKSIPKQLSELVGDVFEIRYRDLTCSHRKLIFSLVELPESTTLVTCDDDLIYPQNWLESLYTDHLNFPTCVIANECRMITYSLEGKILPYKEWKTVREKNFTDPKLLPIGYGGVLYPKVSLHKDATNQDIFLELTPKADDLWFKMMSFINNVQVRRSSNPPTKPIPIIGSQKVSLKKTNVRLNGNEEQWSKLCEYYNATKHFI